MWTEAQPRLKGKKSIEFQLDNQLDMVDNEEGRV